MNAPAPLCPCQTPASCPHKATGRAFHLCRGTDATVPPEERDAYRQLITAGVSTPSPLDLTDIDVLEAMTPEEVDRQAGCTGCGHS